MSPSTMPPLPTSTWRSACTFPITVPSIRITPVLLSVPSTRKSAATIDKAVSRSLGPRGLLCSGEENKGTICSWDYQDAPNFGQRLPGTSVTHPLLPIGAPIGTSISAAFRTCAYSCGTSRTSRSGCQACRRRFDCDGGPPNTLERDSEYICDRDGRKSSLCILIGRRRGDTVLSDFHLRLPSCTRGSWKSFPSWLLLLQVDRPFLGHRVSDLGHSGS